MAKQGDELLGAVKRGDLDTVHNLVEQGFSVNGSYGLQGTLLCAAIQANHPEVALYLIESGCDINASDIDGEPPLCLAIRKGHMEMVKMLLESGKCDIHKVDPVSLNPPLCVAVTHGTTESVKLLVCAGCDIGKQGKEYNTAWHYAVMHRKPEVLDILMEAQSGDINMWNKSGKTALHLAAELVDTAMLSHILRKCPRGTCMVKDDPLHAEKCELHALNAGYPRKVDIDRQIMFNGNTPLHLAIQANNLRATELLIDAGANIHLPNHTMHTPLLFACKANWVPIVKLLLKNGVDPNVSAECHKQFHVRSKVSQQTPLHVAIRIGALDIVKLLVEAGADLNQSASGNYPLMQALMEDKPQIVKYFLDEGVKHGLRMSTVDGTTGQNALGVVECCSNVRGFSQRLLDLGCQVEGLHDELRPLEYAVEFDCSEAVEVLIDNGAKVNTSWKGHSALQYCVAEDMSEDLLHLLLFYGGDINVKTQHNEESLIKLAIDNYNIQVVKYFIAVGYNLSKESYLREFICDSPKKNSDPNSCWSDSESETDSSDGCNCPKELYAWLAERAAFPCKLQTQCRTALRAHFVENEIFMKRMSELPLPQKMKDFLMLKNLFEETQGIEGP